MSTNFTDRINGVLSSLAIKAPVRVATTGNITLSGLQTIDGISLSAGDRVLVKNQTTASENGIYVADSSSWERAADFDGRRDVVRGTLVRVVSGTVNAQMFYEVTTSGTITIDSTSITFSEAVVRSEHVVSVTAFDGVDPTGVSDSTAGIQAALDAHKHVFFPPGIYRISDALVLRPKTFVYGAGASEYIASFGDDVEGTRIVQTTGNPVFTTDIGSPADSFYGDIVVADMTLLGGTVSSHLGTYGFYGTSSTHVTLVRVWAKFFTQCGFYFSGCLRVNMLECSGDYNEDSGLFMDYGTQDGVSDANSYMSNIIGGTYTQNATSGIKLGISTVKVNIVGADIESNGNYYSSGAGYGIYMFAEARTVTIDGCWFEGNKNHIIAGEPSAIPSLSTVLQNTRIQNCELWSTNGGGAKIKFNTGRQHLVENCNFFGGGYIDLGYYTDNPVFRNCRGGYIIRDANNNVLTENGQNFANAFVYSDIMESGYWPTLSNCTVAREYIASPAGDLPVYRITPGATGNVDVRSIENAYTFLTKRHTIGFYVKTDATAQGSVWVSLASTNMSKSYTDSAVDVFPVTQEWSWVSIGRSINPADTGNQQFLLRFLSVASTSPIYISAFVCLPGLVYEPYKFNKGGIATLYNGATPSVYGLSKVVTGGTTTITDLTGGTVGQELTIIAEHTITITDGTNIFLNGSANWTMNATDTLRLICKADGNWYEIGRSDNT